jgi:hypothetical protein
MLSHQARAPAPSAARAHAMRKLGTKQGDQTCRHTRPVHLHHLQCVHRAHVITISEHSMVTNQVLAAWLRICYCTSTEPGGKLLSQPVMYCGAVSRSEKVTHNFRRCRRLQVPQHAASCRLVPAAAIHKTCSTHCKPHLAAAAKRGLCSTCVPQQQLPSWAASDQPLAGQEGC